MVKFLLLLALFISIHVSSQSVTVQDVTIQLDHNGEASITPKDVLVNTQGTLFGIGDFNIEAFDYDQQANSLTFLNQSSLSCNGGDNFYSYDRNPINNKFYVSGFIIDGGDFLSPIDENSECIYDETKFSYYNEFSACNFYFEPPLRMSFDKDGILYEANYITPDMLNTFDVHSNIRLPFAEIFLDPYNSGLTYDFENHRLIATKIDSGMLSFIEIDIETTQVNTLFSIPPPTDCSSNAIEYISNNVLLVGSQSSPCSAIYTINLETEELQFLPNTDYHFSDFLFVENEVENTTLSTSEFSCDDLGENLIDITVIENGQPISLQSTVNVVADFSVRNCPVFKRLGTPDPSNSNDALVDDFTTEISIVSSCSTDFTITQDPLPGTSIPYGELIDINITITDEFNNMAYCYIVACSDSILSNGGGSYWAKSLHTYPNPTNDMVTIENDQNISFSSVAVYDINGKILKTKLPEDNVTKTSISLEDLSSGMYFVKVLSIEGQAIKQIIKN